MNYFEDSEDFPLDNFEYLNYTWTEDDWNYYDDWKDTYDFIRDLKEVKPWKKK